MKKIGLLIITLLLFSTVAFAEVILEEETIAIEEKLIPNYNEMAFYYSSRTDVGPTGESLRFWHLESTRLGWKGDNYCVDLAMSPLVSKNPMVIKEAWFTLTPFEFMDVSIGKIAYDFCKVSSRSFNNITAFQPQLFDAAWQTKFSGDFGDAGWNVYWADGGSGDSSTSYDAPSTLGFKLTYNLAGLDIGAALKNRDWDADTSYVDLGFDFIYSLGGLAKINLQLYNIDQDNDTNDLNFFGIVSCEKGFMLPFLNNTKPYLGYFSKDDADGEAAKEGNFVIGLHSTPLEDTYLKFEYNNDSDANEDTSDLDNNDKMSNALTFEVGYKF